MEKMNEIVTIGGIDCYEENGTAYLKLETVARGLGFTQEKNGAEYVRWDRLEEYLSELGFPHKWGKDDFIPENVFYRLAMKAKNETAEKFQAYVADEDFPYSEGAGTEEQIMDWIEECGLSDEEDKAKMLCWKVIEGFRNVVKTAPTILASQWISVKDRLPEEQNVPYEKLAKEYGVSKKTMQNAIKGKTWKCVEYFPEPPKEVRDDGAHIKPELR